MKRDDPTVKAICREIDKAIGLKSDQVRPVLDAINKVAAGVAIKLPMEDFRDSPILIWSEEHGAWWRPARRGYTTDRTQAGRYTIRDALGICGHCGPEKRLFFEFVE